MRKQITAGADSNQRHNKAAVGCKKKKENSAGRGNKNQNCREIHG